MRLCWDYRWQNAGLNVLLMVVVEIIKLSPKVLAEEMCRQRVSLIQFRIGFSCPINLGNLLNYREV